MFEIAPPSAVQGGHRHLTLAKHADGKNSCRPGGEDARIYDLFDEILDAARGSSGDWLVQRGLAARSVAS